MSLRLKPYRHTQVFSPGTYAAIATGTPLATREPRLVRVPAGQVLVPAVVDPWPRLARSAIFRILQKRGMRHRIAINGINCIHAQSGMYTGISMNIRNHKKPSRKLHLNPVRHWLEDSLPNRRSTSQEFRCSLRFQSPDLMASRAQQVRLSMTRTALWVSILWISI